MGNFMRTQTAPFSRLTNTIIKSEPEEDGTAELNAPERAADVSMHDVDREDAKRLASVVTKLQSEKDMVCNF
jgi:hypothetical protein